MKNERTSLWDLIRWSYYATRRFFGIVDEFPE